MFALLSSFSGISCYPLMVFFAGLVGGFVSGFLGVGCGIIITPVLMEMGIPTLTAVSTQLYHAVGTNLSNFLTYNRKRDVDFHVAFFILLGGFLGALCEWMTLKYCHNPKIIIRKFEYIYIFILFIFGIIILFQSWKSLRKKNNHTYKAAVMMRRWMLYLPCHQIFKRSRAEMSVFVPIMVGFFAGMIVASLGGGNNLFMAPIITYLIGRISPVVQGTTALAGFVITIVVAFVYAERGYFCDFFLVMLLFAGASIGSWIGVKLTYQVRRTYIQMVASVVVFAMAFRMAFRLFGKKEASTISVLHHDLSISTFFQFARENPIIYTTACILIICSIAFFTERGLQKWLDNRHRNAKEKKRKRN